MLGKICKVICQKQKWQVLRYMYHSSHPVNALQSNPRQFILSHIVWIISVGKEIANLSLRYSNLKGYGIKNLQLDLTNGNLSTTYVNSVQSAGNAINPKLQLDQNMVDLSDKIAPGLPQNITAILQNVNTNPNLPLSISPIAGNTQYWWGSHWNTDWDIDAMQGTAVVVANPSYDNVNSSPSVLRIGVYKNKNYNGFDNNSPRAEIDRLNFNFNYGKTYSYTFKNYIASDYKFDSDDYANATMLTQIKQEVGALSGL